MKRLLLLLAGLLALNGSSLSAHDALVYANADAAKRLGYEPQSITGDVEHWVNAGYFRDGRVLDPNRPESLMFVRTRAGLRLVASVFVFEHPGEAPVVADAAWHHHSSCLGPGGLGEPLPGGPCPPGTVLEDTPPMLHVWVDGTEELLNEGTTYCRLSP